jgi:hypothetical protein
LVFDELSPRELPTSQVTQTTAGFFERFEKLHPGLLDRLRGVPCTDESGWFVAGGSVLRTLMTHERAKRLFSKSDVDVFIYVKGSGGDDGSRRATEIAHTIAKALFVPLDGSEIATSRLSADQHLTRTLWTINLECQLRSTVQIILRVYHSPAEVLCGFDIDACCGWVRWRWARVRCGLYLGL